MSCLFNWCVVVRFVYECFFFPLKSSNTQNAHLVMVREHEYEYWIHVCIWFFLCVCLALALFSHCSHSNRKTQNESDWDHSIYMNGIRGDKMMWMIGLWQCHVQRKRIFALIYQGHFRWLHWKHFDSNLDIIVLR